MALFNILVFPGFLFLTVFALAGEYLDRILYARFQNRQGPPWFQPVADLIKLAAKEDTVPESADRSVFTFMPILALASTVTAILYIPIWGTKSLFPFEGDLIVVAYLLTIPTLTFFLGGWFSRSLYSLIGAARAIMQLFAYEIPLLLALLGPAMLAGSWSISDISTFYAEHWGLALLNLVVALPIALVALLGKLERVPFDTPEAETEIVAGSFTEYGGRLLAIFRLCIDVEMIVAASLLAAVFLPFWLDVHPALGLFLYLLKVELLILALSFARSVAARLRIDQMIDFCWKYLAPVSLAWLVVSMLLKGAIG